MDEPSRTLQEKPVLKTIILAQLLSMLLGLSATATAVFILAGVPTKTVMETAALASMADERDRAQVPGELSLAQRAVVE